MPPLSMKLSGEMSSRLEYEPWDHGLSRIAKNPKSMDQNVQYVEENWKTEAFMSFCFFNARIVSMTPKEGINKLKEDEKGFWNIVHPVDIAWAVTKRVDNEERWKEKYENTHKGKVITAKEQEEE